jgi:hypothetical protein
LNAKASVYIFSAEISLENRKKENGHSIEIPVGNEHGPEGTIV